MRMIGSVTNEADAARLGDYLLSSGIDNHVERSGDGASWAVWIERDDDLDRARQELDQFQRNPADERYSRAAREAGRIRAERAVKRKRWTRNLRDVRGGWLVRSRSGPGPVTLAIMALCGIVAASTWIGMEREKLNPLLIQPVEYHEGGWVSWPRELVAVKQGEVWRLVTPILIHHGAFHLLFNMMWLFHLGSQIEHRKGALALVLLVIVSAIPSNVLQFMSSIEETGPMFGGMSGVVYALIGYVWMKGRFQPQEGMGLDRSSIIIAMVWLVLCMTVLKNIANTAHIVGLGIGLALGAMPYVWERARRGK
jgi:GlpG protein